MEAKKNKQTDFPDTLTPEQIAELKEKHGYDMVLEAKVGDKTAWFRNIDMQTKEAAAAQPKKSDFYKVVANTCFVGGDRALIDDPKLFHHLMTQLDDIVYWLDVEVKKY